LRYNVSIMFTFLLIISVIAFLLLLLVASMHPIHSQLSLFELERRATSGDESAQKALEREKLLNDIISLQHVVTSLLLIIIVLLSVSTFGWIIGIFVALFVALEYGAIARIKFLRQIAQKLYAKIDSSLLKFVKKVPVLFALLRSALAGDDLASNKIDSREELQHLVDESGKCFDGR